MEEYKEAKMTRIALSCSLTAFLLCLGLILCDIFLIKTGDILLWEVLGVINFILLIVNIISLKKMFPKKKKEAKKTNKKNNPKEVKIEKVSEEGEEEIEIL